ncbi:MAG TPA: hypothetical protein VF598_03095 [Hymenobacter sp.]|jgi:hypothetical protein
MPEKLQTLLIILLGLLALVVRWWKKAQDTMRREAQERRLPVPSDDPRSVRPLAPALPATSFEELLKQMQTQNQQSPVPTAAPRPATFSTQTTPVGQPLPRRPHPITQSSERPDRKPVLREAPAAPPVRQRASALPRASAQQPDDQRNRQAATPEAGRNDLRRHVTDLLRSPADVRAAFVLSEILKRKYE